MFPFPLHLESDKTAIYENMSVWWYTQPFHCWWAWDTVSSTVLPHIMLYKNNVHIESLWISKPRTFKTSDKLNYIARNYKLSKILGATTKLLMPEGWNEVPYWEPINVRRHCTKFSHLDGLAPQRYGSRTNFSSNQTCTLTPLLKLQISFCSPERGKFLILNPVIFKTKIFV